MSLFDLTQAIHEARSYLGAPGPPTERAALVATAVATAIIAEDWPTVLALTVASAVPDDDTLSAVDAAESIQDALRAITTGRNVGLTV